MVLDMGQLEEGLWMPSGVQIIIIMRVDTLETNIITTLEFFKNNKRN